MLFWGGIWVFCSLLVIGFFVAADSDREDYSEYYEKEEIKKRNEIIIR